MAADVHGHVPVAGEHGVEPALHVLPLYVILAGVGVDGVVSQDDDPVLLGGGERGVHPVQLLLYVLLASVGVFVALLAVLVYQGRGVHEHEPDGHAAVLYHLGVVAGGHLPSAAHLGVVEHGLRVAPVLVVAQRGIPGQHQLGVGVDELVVGHPERVADAGHALEVVYVTYGGHALYAHGLGHAAHGLGDGFLVIVSVAAQVVGHVEVHVFLQLLPLGGSLRPGGEGRQQAELQGQ